MTFPKWPGRKMSVGTYSIRLLWGRILPASLLFLALGMSPVVLANLQKPETIICVMEITDFGLTNPGAISSTNLKVSDRASLKTGQLLQVDWQGSWWACQVLEAYEDGQAKIHYLGWDAQWDEIVPRSRLQIDPDCVEKARNAQAQVIGCVESILETECISVEECAIEEIQPETISRPRILCKLPREKSSR